MGWKQNQKRGAITALLMLEGLWFSVALTPNVFAQTPSVNSPIEWIAKKADAQNKSKKEQNKFKERKLKPSNLKSNIRTQMSGRQEIEKEYLLDLSDEAATQVLKAEVMGLYGKPSKTTSDSLTWYVPNPNYSQDRAAMTSVTITEDKNGNAKVVVKQMTREKSSRPSQINSRRSDK